MAKNLLQRPMFFTVDFMCKTELKLLPEISQFVLLSIQGAVVQANEALIP